MRVGVATVLMKQPLNSLWLGAMRLVLERTAHAAVASVVFAGALFTQVQPSQAAVIAEGAVRSGYYWQLVEGSNGTRCICCSTSSSKFQKHAKCNEAGAKKP